MTTIEIDPTATAVSSSSEAAPSLGLLMPVNDKPPRHPHFQPPPPLSILASKNETLSSSAALTTSAPPAIDFKLNVKIEIKSGKCVLHANNSAVGDARNSTSGGVGGGSSPVSSTFYQGHSAAAVNNNNNFALINSLMQNAVASDQELRNTNFIFPAIGVKAFYESTHQPLPSTFNTTTTTTTNISQQKHHPSLKQQQQQQQQRLAKKANLYAMIKLESFAMPSSSSSHAYAVKRDLLSSRDMCISPALLDFLEQTLEPFDMIRSSLDAATASSNLTRSHTSRAKEKPASASAATAATAAAATASTSVQTAAAEPSYFPVDVIVFVSMLPSSIRFTCLPGSTMECLLKLPTLEMVFSTNRLESHYQTELMQRLSFDQSDEAFEALFRKSSMHARPGAPAASSTLANLGSGGSSRRSTPTHDTQTPAASASSEGGLSVTCSMTDFSLKFYNRLAMRNQVDPRFYYADQLAGGGGGGGGGGSGGGGSSYTTDDKDSLSVRVAYIKVNIARTRRVSKPVVLLLNGESNDDAAEANDVAKEAAMGLNDVKLSVLADVGESSFIYDMRNIKEVFVFPKIWYRRSLARRLFLGEESSSATATATAQAATNINGDAIPMPAPASSARREANKKSNAAEELAATANASQRQQRPKTLAFVTPPQSIETRNGNCANPSYLYTIIHKSFMTS